MAGNPLVDVVMAAALMKATQPQHFKSFCDAVRLIEVQAIAELAAADAPHDMFRAQGKMKFVQQFRKHLTDCTELRDTYQRRDQHVRQPTA